jgi:uncharacterized protein YprB with RNaseH-like and TPR domain
MVKIVIDIETVGFDFEAFEKKTQEYLLKYASTEEEKVEVKKRLGLYPLTGEIVAIGMLNPDTQKGILLFQNNNSESVEFEENGITYQSGTEKNILEKFWEIVEKYDTVITFNGRAFDVPFLLLRSAKYFVRPTKNLLGYRYEFQKHCDLLDQLTFYGAMRKFNLDFYAKFFGIKSSKEDGIDGSMVSELYQTGRYLEIARYCGRDLATTKELYLHWDKYLKF